MTGLVQPDSADPGAALPVHGINRMLAGDFDLFARVVQTGSMSSAGRDLGLAPGVVSKRMKRLEERLGARLLHRTTRRIALTELGRGFYERVLAALSAIEDAETFASRSSGLAAGVLRVSAPSAFGRLHIAPHLKPFLDANPDIHIELNLSDEYIDLIEGGYDLAIRIGSLPDSTLIARKLVANERILCATPAYLRSFGEPRMIEDLQHHRLLARSSQKSWRLEGPEGIRQVKVSSVISSNSTEVVREAMLSGLGIALRSTWDLGDALQRGAVRHVLPQVKGASDVNLYAIYPSRRFIPQKVGSFIAYLANLYGHRPYWEDSAKMAFPEAETPILQGR